MALNLLAFQNADVLRALSAGGHESNKALAKSLGRDDSNLGRSLRSLLGAGLITEASHRAELTPAGADQLAALDRADGINPDGAPAPAMPSGFALIPHQLIVPDGLNPRKHFDETELAELAESIAQDGLLENLVVRPINDGDTAHRLVAGERRWRALRLLIAAGRWDQPIPCKIVEIDDAAHRRIALVENLQRKDLRPIDEAQALKDLMEVTGQGTAEIAKEIGFTQRFVQQRLQLLALPPKTQEQVNAGALTLERAREEIARINRATEAAEKRKLAPDELLAMAEIFTAGERHGVRLQSWYPATWVPVGHRGLEEGDALHRLEARDAIEVERGFKDQPLVFVRPSHEYGPTELNAQLPGFIGRKRDEVLLRLGEQVHGKAEALRIAATLGKISGERGEYFTWALNEPFCSTPDPALEEAAETWRQENHAAQAEAFHRECQRKAAEEAAQAERDRVKAQVEADHGEPGRAFLADVRAFEDAAPGLTHADFTQAFAALMARHDGAGPYAIVWNEEDRLPLMADGNGVVHRASAFAFEARRRLQAIALNYALGLTPYSGPDIEAPYNRPPEEEANPDAIPRKDFVWMIAGILADDIDDLDEAEANLMAERGLAAYLAAEVIDYGDPAYDWEEAGAMTIAQAIRKAALGQAKTADEDADADADALETEDA